MELDYNKWDVDPGKGLALHASGALIRFNGHPDSDNFEGNLSGFPGTLTALEKARLVRHGFEAYRQAFTQPSPQPRRRQPTERA